MMTKKNLIAGFIRKNKGVAVGSSVFGFLSIASTVLIPIFLAKFYQLSLRTHSARGAAFDKIFGRIDNIEVYFILFGALIFLKLIFDYYQKFFSGIGSELFAKSLREQLFEKQLKTKLNAHEKKETGKYLLRYSGDMNAIQKYLTNGIFAFIKDCLFLVLAMALLLAINVELALIVIIIFPFLFLLVVLINRQLKRYTRKRRNTRSHNLAFVSTRLNSILTIKAFNRESTEVEKFEKRSTKLYQYGRKYYFWYGLLNGLIPFMLYLMLLVILGYAYIVNHPSTKDTKDNQIVSAVTVNSESKPQENIDGNNDDAAPDKLLSDSDNVNSTVSPDARSGKDSLKASKKLSKKQKNAADKKEGIPGHVILIFILQVVNFIPAMRRILSVNVIWQAGDVSIKKLLDILNKEQEWNEASEGVRNQSAKIEFRNVSFSYQENPVLKKLNFEILPGSITLLRGVQGSGKSTVMKLILGLYDCDEGEILLNGKDIKTISRHSLRKNVTMVSDELPLVGHTIFEAISYSRKPEKRDAAAKVLNELGFNIEGAESILDYPVTEGGKNISAGQRKLLFFARALLTKKKIILMDEPFRNLDERNKQKIRELIHELKTNHTLLITDSGNNVFQYDYIIDLPSINQNFEYEKTG